MDVTGIPFMLLSVFIGLFSGSVFSWAFLVPIFYRIPRALYWAGKNRVQRKAWRVWIVRPIAWTIIYFFSAAIPIFIFPEKSIQLIFSVPFTVAHYLGWSIPFLVYFSPSYRGKDMDFFLMVNYAYLTPEGLAFVKSELKREAGLEKARNMHEKTKGPFRFT